jgi:hypothetical protein
VKYGNMGVIDFLSIEFNINGTIHSASLIKFKRFQKGWQT